MLGHKSTGKSLSRTGQLCVIERRSLVADVAVLTTASIVVLSPTRLHQRAEWAAESIAPETTERASVTRYGASRVILLVETVQHGS